MAEIDPDQTQTLFRPVHQDRRSLPRVTLRCSGKALLPNGEVINVIIHDLSRDGVQIRCSKVAAQAINPSGKAVQEGQAGPELKVEFDVPLKSGSGKVRARGTLLYFSLIAPDVAALGMRFSSISREGVKHLRSVVKAALQPS